MSLPNIARNLAAKGRNGDTMLVHMTPGEVQGLQALAMAHGGSLSINPNTGLPEANILKRLLPTIAGVGLTMMGVPAPLAAGIVGGGTALASGSLEKGLMAGIGAYGGASLAGSAANLAAPAATAANTGAAAATTATTAAGAPVATANPAMLGSELASQNIIPQATKLGGQNILQTVAEPATGAFDMYGMADPTLAATKTTLATAPAPMTAADKLAVGFENATSSLENFGNYLGNNKMNLAMAASPALFVEPEPIEPMGSPQMIRPFELAIDNVSGQSPYDPSGREQQQITYSYNALEPYEAKEAYKRRTPFTAAQGGVVALQEGGVAQTTSAPADVMPITPSTARTLQNISLIQGLAGIPRINAPIGPFTPGTQPSIGLTPRAIPSTIERRYGIAMPDASKSSSFELAKKARERKEARNSELDQQRIDEMNAGGAAAGGMMPNNLKPIRRNMGGSMGLAALAGGGTPRGRFLQGPGDGVSDSIPGVIRARDGGMQPARLADGEFVIDARTVSEIGNGSSKAGAKKLYAMMDRVHKARKKAGRGKDSKADRYLPA
jgi:hypothetical protein